MSLNRYRNCHYMAINQAKQEYKLLMRIAIQESGLKIRQLNWPIKTIFRFADWRRRDIDGEAISIKNAHDALVDLGMLPDDSRKYLLGFQVEALEEKGEWYELEILETNS